MDAGKAAQQGVSISDSWRRGPPSKGSLSSHKEKKTTLKLPLPGTFSLRASLYNGGISLPALLLREYGLERCAGALSLIVSYVSFPVRYRLWETGNVCETGQAGGGKSQCCSVWAAGWLVMTLLPLTAPDPRSHTVPAKQPGLAFSSC